MNDTHVTQCLSCMIKCIIDAVSRTDSAIKKFFLKTSVRQNQFLIFDFLLLEPSPVSKFLLKMFPLDPSLPVQLLSR